MKWFVAVFVLIFLSSHLFAEAPGTLLWSIQLEKSEYSSWPPEQYSLALGHEGTIYANTGFLYAVDKDGDTIWRYLPPAEYDDYKHIAASPPVIASDGTIYVTLRCLIPRSAISCQYQLVALSPEGLIKWQAESVRTCEDRGLTNLTILGNGNIVIGLAQWLYLYSPAGELLKSQTDYPHDCYAKMIGSIASDSNDNVYHWYGGWEWYELYKLNSNLEIELSPSVNWRTFADGSDMGSAFLIDGNGRIYTTCHLAADGTWPEGWYFGCLTPDGEAIWRNPREDLSSEKQRSLIIDNKQRIFCQLRFSHPYSRKLLAFTTSGEDLWKLELDKAQNLSHMVLGDANVLYFGLGNKIVAYSTENQQLLWTFENDTTIIFMTMNQAGTLYGIDINAKVLALTTESTGVEKSAWPMFQHDAQNTGHVSPVETLPVEFIAVEASFVENAVKLSWAVEEVQNIQQFEVERAFLARDGATPHWIVVGNVAVVQGTQNVHYEFVDALIESNGTFVYRISAVESYGQVTISQELQVEVSFVKFASVEVHFADNAVDLTWVIEGSQNVLRFEVERAYLVSKGVTSPWIVIGRLPGNQDKENLQYKFVDDSFDASLIYFYRIKAIKATGEISLSQEIQVMVNLVFPEKFTVYPIFPNPFNAQAKLKLYQPKTAPLKIRVYDVNGKVVTDLIDDVLPAGEHEFHWDGSFQPSGIYFFQISGPDVNFVERAVLLK